MGGSTALSFLQAARDGAQVVRRQGGRSELQRGRAKLWSHVIDGVVGGCGHHQTHCRHHWSKVHGRQGLLPHYGCGGTLLTWGRRDASGS
jgi:hypothetical protein